MSPHHDTPSAPVLPADLTLSIERAGYYPALVADVVESALGRDTVEAHLVHQETTFDQAGAAAVLAEPDERRG